MSFGIGMRYFKSIQCCKGNHCKGCSLSLPDYSDEFEINTDASSGQVDEVIIQQNRPIAFFSRKLSEAQQKYSVTEVELLAIMETLKEFKDLL